MGRWEALEGLRDAVTAAITAAGITAPGIDVVGEPVDTELAKVLSTRGATPYEVTIFPLGGGEIDWYPPGAILATRTVPALTAALAGNVVTLTGAIAVGVPVHIGIDDGLADVAYVTLTGDTLGSIASALVAKIDALGISGLSAAAVGGVITVTGANALAIDVAASDVILTEVGVQTERFQVTVWTQDPMLRGQVENAIVTRVGTELNRAVALSDGTDMDCLVAGAPRWMDQEATARGAYQSHIAFDCTYSLTVASTATEIAAGLVTQTTDGASSTTRYTFGGPA